MITGYPLFVIVGVRAIEIPTGLTTSCSGVIGHAAQSAQTVGEKRLGVGGRREGRRNGEIRRMVFRNFMMVLIF
jgi:hypothetical protein